MSNQSAILNLAAIMAVCVALFGCQSYPDEVKERAKKTGVPVETVAVLWPMLKNADENEGLTEIEWKKLEEFANSADEATRMETITVLGGISKKKSSQVPQVIEFLERRQQDASQNVRDHATAFLGIFEPNQIKEAKE